MSADDDLRQTELLGKYYEIINSNPPAYREYLKLLRISCFAVEFARHSEIEANNFQKEENKYGKFFFILLIGVGVAFGAYQLLNFLSPNLISVSQSTSNAVTASVAFLFLYFVWAIYHCRTKALQSNQLVMKFKYDWEIAGLSRKLMNEWLAYHVDKWEGVIDIYELSDREQALQKQTDDECCRIAAEGWF